MTSEPMLTTVLRALDAAKGVAHQRQIAADSGVPYSTLCKIAQRRIANPGVAHVQALFDYFRRQAGGDTSAEVGSPAAEAPAESVRAAACDTHRSDRRTVERRRCPGRRQIAPQEPPAEQLGLDLQEG